MTVLSYTGHWPSPRGQGEPFGKSLKFKEKSIYLVSLEPASFMASIVKKKNKTIFILDMR